MGIVYLLVSVCKKNMSKLSQKCFIFKFSTVGPYILTNKGRYVRKPVFSGLRTIKAQTSLCGQAI